MRKQAREYAFKLIFEYLFLKEKNVEGLLEFIPQDLTESDKQYVEKIYSGVLSNFDSLCQQLSQLSSDFSLQRIYKVDLSILLLSMFEIKYMDDVPDVVSVNEAVELAKAYSTDKSHSFVNGILAAYLKEKGG